jgi:serine/threonine protein kinase
MVARVSRNARSYIQSFGTRTGEGLRSRFEYIDQDAFDFLSNMLRLDPEERVTIQQALEHPFLDSCRDVTSETVATKNIVLDFEQANGFNEDYLSRHFVDNIRIIQGGA